MKRIFSLITVLVALQFTAFSASHTFKVTSAESEGANSLKDIVAQINELPEEDEALIVFNLPASAKDTVHAEESQFVIRRVVSLDGGDDKTIIKSRGFVFSDTVVGYIKNIDFVGNNGYQSLLFYSSLGEITGSSFTGYKTGILMVQTDKEPSSIDLVRDCAFNCSEKGISSYGKVNVIENCTFSNCETGVGLYHDSKNTYSPSIDKITNCSFVNCVCCVNLFSETINEISFCQSDGGTFDIHSSSVKSLVNDTLRGPVSIYSAVSDIKDCYFVSYLSFYASKVDCISGIRADAQIKLTNAEISTLKNSKINAGIAGANVGDLRMIYDTITNPAGNAIGYVGNISLLDHCLIYDCVNGVYSTSVDTIRNTHIYNCVGDGLYNDGAYQIACISNCEIDSCSVGVDSEVGKIESVKIYNNKECGIKNSIKIGEIIDCDIFNAKIGIENKGTLSRMSDSRIYDNEIGVDHQYGALGTVKNCEFLNNKGKAIYAVSMVNVDSLSDCIFSGSDTAVYFGRVSGTGSSAFVPTVVENNVIGKDGIRLDLNGNEVGLYIDNLSYVAVKGNIISGNRNVGLYVKGHPSLVVENNYFGTNSTGSVIGNGVGLESHLGGNTSVLKENVFAYNQIGVLDAGEQLGYDHNIFNANANSGISYTTTSSSGVVDMRSNEFLDTPEGAKALTLTESLVSLRRYPTPIITDVTLPDKDGYVYVSGKTGIDTVKLNVDIFASDGRNQVILAHLASDSTDQDGNFKVRVKAPESLLQSFAAQIERVKYSYLSEFSDTYTVPLVGPFYVRTQAHGTADGSSWLNAMDGETFAKCLPFVVDGTTFHVAKGDYSNVGGGDLSINSSVTIIGGYDDVDAEIADLDPSQYITLFKSDSDIQQTITIKDSKNVNFRNVCFSEVAVSSVKKCVLHIDHCTFYGFARSAVSLSNADSLIVDNSIFRDSRMQGIIHTDGFGYVGISNSGFYNLSSPYSNSAVYAINGKSLVIDNTTFVNNPSTNFLNLSSIEQAGLYSNTLVGNGCLKAKCDTSYGGMGMFSNVTLIGNIYLGNKKNSLKLSADCSSRNNIYYEDFQSASSSDILLADSILPRFMDVVYDESIDRYVPNLKRHGGFVPTVALKSDTLPDGTSIRFRRNSKTPLSDQRDYSRPTNPCRGAYELCVPIEVTSYDTIKLGEPFRGVAYDKPQQVTGISDTLSTAFGCDSIVNHVVFVLPDPTVKGYYVKEDGDGDGSDWDHAMGPKDFAYVFNNISTDGVSFYIAQGKYKPVYDGYGLETNNHNSRWNTEHASSLYGGFDPNSTGLVQLESADPKQYPTIFTGDMNDDDILLVGEDCSTYSYSNRSDNVGVTLVNFREITGDVTVSGIDFTGMVTSKGNYPSLLSIVYNMDSEGAAHVSNCTFTQSHRGITCNYSRDFSVDNCGFSYLSTDAIECYGSCRVANSTFKNTSGIIFNSITSGLDLSNSTFVNNTPEVFVYPVNDGKGLENKIVNNTFVSCNGVSRFNFSSLMPTSFIGNIFAGDHLTMELPSDDEAEVAEQTFKYNLFACNLTGVEDFVKGDASNIVMEDATPLYEQILDGEYLSEGNIFKANLKDNGGFTQTVALINNQLSDGRKLTFPLSETLVTRDQRGVNRFDMTCMGAYEITCSSDTFAVDTVIYEGESFQEIAYHIVGQRDTVFERLTASNGCDSLVQYNLIVKQSPLIVTNENNEGEGSLRNAVEYANKLNAEEPVEIIFRFDEPGRKVIKLDTTITILRGNITINGASTPEKVVIEAKDQTYSGLYVPTCNKSNIFITDLTFKNFMQAVDLHAVDSAVVKDCVFDGNYYGISNYVSNVTVINSNFVRNKVGYYTAHNHYYGCSSKHKTIIKGSVFGLDMDQTAAEPNEVGIEISGSSGGNSSDHYIDISQNVISGNDSHGIYINSSFIGNDKNRIIHSNLIGTNKYNEHFGNGGDGINVTVSASSLYIGSFSLDSANVIAFNRKNGISCGNWNSINILNNYIGLSKDFEPLPNEGCGVYSVNTIYNFEGNYIGFNGEDGVRSEGSATLSNNFIGGDGVHDFGNGGYGVNCCRTKLFRNNIWNNHKGGVNKDCETTKYPVEFIYASQNLFGGSAQKSAISDVDKKINIPQIDEVRANKDSIFIIGKVALLDRENMEVSLPRYIDTSSVTIELFANAGEPETAHKYVDVIETDSLGNYQFKFALNDSKVAGSLSFVTTATFRFIEDYGIGTNYYTSGLSQTYTYDVSDTVMAYDTICAAIDYNENGWNISADELSESGDYRFERIGQPIMGGNALEVLYLHVLPLRKAEISYLDVQSPECAAEPFGSLQFSAEAKNNALWTVSVKNESGDVLAAQPFINSTNNNTTRGSSIAKRFVVKFLAAYFPPIGRLDSLKPGYYDIVLHSTATCTADTTYRVNVEAFSEPVIMGQTDTTLVTLCRNESQAKYTTTIEGFKPSMKVFLDDKDVNLTGNMSLSVSSAEKKAQVSLEAIPAGDHQLTAVDSCGKAYLLSNIHVLAPDTISLVVSDHAKMPLKCSYDKLPYMELVVSGGVEPKVSVESDYIHTNFLRHDTIRIENYPVGDYTFIARTNVDNCTDEKSLDFRVEGPDSLSIDLQTNAYGKFCEEGGYDLEAVTSGESGNYTFTWSCPTGEEKVTTSNILKNVGPGFYTCVVKDNEGCSQALDTALLSLDVELSKIKINGIKQSATCFSAPYAKISVNYSNNNAKQVVTCLLNDKNTGELVKSATSKLQNGALVLTEVPVGTYDLSVRYGTPDCVLDTTKYANETITVNPKSEPLSIGTPVIKPQSCVTKPNGMISVAVAGWDDYSSFMDNRRIRPDSIIASTAYFNVKNLGGGKHVFVVKDACDGKDSVVVDESQMPVLVPAVMSLSHLIDTVKCAREKSAQVAVNIQGGAPDQGLIVFDGVEYPYDRNSILFGGLGKGKHTIVYRSDDETCEHDVITKTIEVKGPDTLSVQFALTGIDCDAAKLLVVAKGETSPYLFIWDENGKTSNPSLLSVSPFAPKSDSVYGLTVKDAAGCDSMYTQFRVPNANELPQLLINPIGYPEKCYQGNNGSMDIWFSSGSNKLPFGMMVTIELTKDGKPFKTYERAIQDKESYLIQLVDCLEPGDYEVSARYGSKECQMTTHQAVGKTHVEALHKLTIGSNVAVSPQTCTRANGEVSLDIDGWNDSHSVELYRVVKIHFPLIGSLSYNVRTAMTYEALKEGQLCHMRITGLKSASYFFKVSDVCGNSAKSNTFFVDYIPTTIENGSTERLTCLGKPNGVVNFEVHGWTPSHGCELVKDDQRLEVVSPALPYEIDQEKKIAYFRIDTVTAGNWRIWVSNECGESMMSDTLCTVKGINPYNINLDEKHSKLHLDCPYSEDGVVSLTVTGGIAPTEFFANRTMVVPKEQFAGYDTIVSVKFDTVMVEQLVYDSTNCVVVYDTTVSGAARDTVITSFLDCPIKIDPVTGDFVRELTPKVQRVIDTTYVERYATVNTTVYDSLPSDLFYSTEPITVGGIFTIGYKLVKRYKAEDQKVGAYEYTYKSAVEGCPDKAVKKVVIDRPYPVTLVSQTLDVSCTSATDGHISLKPIRRYTRLPEKPQFVVNHDTTGNYGVSDVYNFSSDSVQTASGKVPSNNYTRTKDANGNNLYDHIDRLDDVSDFTSITWSYKPFKGTAWNAISPVVPYRSDSTEQYYYDANGTLIKSPVYSSFHLDDFWIDYNGKFQHYDVQSIANLNPGYYAVEVQDKKNCVYHDTLPVNLPPNKLEIVDIQFDEEGAICDPKKRQIHVDVRGGWGNYMYSFTNVSKTDTSIGRLTSGFRGGEATYFNDKDTTGWGESHFLEPGDYMIHVIDEKGCIVSSERKYSVTTKFEMKADTLQVICPRDESIKNEVYFYNSTPAVATYNIYDLQSTCIPDEVDSCRNKSYKEMLFDKAPISRNGKSLFDLDLTVGTHGLFVYENVEGGCGTYLEATIIDTLIPLNMTLKRDSISKLISLCHDSKDATAEFFIMGGTPDYKIVRNPSWGSEEIMEIDGVPQVFTPELKTIHYDSKNALGQDTVIERKYITLDGLQSGTYYFSTIDALGCVRPFGGDSIDSVRVYKPDTLKVEFATSAICPDASITTGGNIFFNKAKGGTAPYTYSFQHGDGPLTECGTVQSIPMAKAIPTVYMAITDANGCKLDTTINFLNDKFVVDTIDFWASTWRHKGDILSLIDICTPVEYLDSVSYTFKKHSFDDVDTRIETLDKRMYIYDIENGQEKYKKALFAEGVDTKRDASDAYFKNHFNLLVDDTLAMHINFIQMNDTTGDWIMGSNLQDSVWVIHDVKMTAYFKGCAYETQYRELKVAFDTIPLYYGGLATRGEILDLNVGPNPCEKLSETYITVNFSASVEEAQLNVYHLDGGISGSYHIKKDVDDKHWKSATEYDDAEFKISLGELLDANFVDNSAGSLIIFVSTKNDRQSTHVLLSPSVTQ